MTEAMLQLQLWQMQLADISDADLRLGLSWLSDDELGHYGNCRSKLRKRQFALGRLLLRGALSHLVADRSPGQWRIVTAAHGKPSLDAGNPPIGFNLAHSGDRIVLLTGPASRLGVDLEYGLKQRNVERLVRRWFNPPELAELMQLAPAARLQWFYQLWTLKEAWSKACGEALAPSLRRITVTGAENARTNVLISSPEPAHWQFLRVQTGPGYFCTLACESDAEIRLASRRMTGLAQFEAMDSRILERVDCRC